MIRPGREQLGGLVEVDETTLGGPKPGKRGRGAAGKALIAVAVEDKVELGRQSRRKPRLTGGLSVAQRRTPNPAAALPGFAARPDLPF
jgi:hypothetical protein